MELARRRDDEECPAKEEEDIILTELSLQGCGPPFVVGGAERRVNRILHLTSEGGACSTPWSMEHGERIE